METIKNWEKEHGELGRTATVETPHNGLHFYFVDLDKHKTINGILPGIDIKSEGGCITLPPSFVDGKKYKWLDGQEISDGITPANGSIKALLETKEGKTERNTAPSMPVTIGKGNRVSSMVSLVGCLVNYGLDPETIKIAVQEENRIKCVPALSQQELEKEVFPALKRGWRAEKPYAKSEIEKIESKEGLPDPVGMGTRRKRGFKERAPEIIKGVLRKGERMLLAGAAKSGKSFAVMDLMAASLAGGEWFGHTVQPGRWLYVNLELDEAECEERIRCLLEAYRVPEERWDMIEIASFENEMMDMYDFRNYMEQYASRNYTAIIIDAFYMLSDADENSNSEVTKMLRVLNGIAKITGSAIILCHHFAKGSSAYRTSVDKASGAGALARYPNAIVTMDVLDQDKSERQQHKAIRAEFTLRSGDEAEPVNLWFEYPIFTMDREGVLDDRPIVSEETLRKKASAIAKAEEARQEFAEQAVRIDEVIEAINGKNGFALPDFVNEYGLYDATITTAGAKKILRTHKFISRKTGSKETWYRLTD